MHYNYYDVNKLEPFLLNLIFFSKSETTTIEREIQKAITQKIGAMGVVSNNMFRGVYTTRIVAKTDANEAQNKYLFELIGNS